MSIKPISPDEVVSAKQSSLPDEVIAVFNELIAANWTGGRSVVKQDAVISLICERMDISRALLFERHYLDVEDVYRALGWRVEYDRPGYNETYPATFTFQKARK